MKIATFFLHVLLTASILTGLHPTAFTQQFQNSDLEGTEPAASTAPESWELIPHSDPDCMAVFEEGATADLVNETEPFVVQGVPAYAYSGGYFVSGAIANYASDYWHEGIQQEVSGLTPGESYEVHFYQAVNKQAIYPDTSGSWQVLANNMVIGTSAPSISVLDYNDLNISWEQRSLSFVAQDSTVLFKFFPFDDDNDHQLGQGNQSGALRMGIDSIWLEACSQVVPEVIENNGELSTDINGEAYAWLDCDTGIEVASSVSFTPEVTGNYAVQITLNGCEIQSDCYSFIVTSATSNWAPDSFVLSPNPASSHTILNLGPTPRSGTVSLLSITGQVIWQTHLVSPELEIDCNNLSPGIYLIHIRGLQGSTVNRLVIE